ncbi:hypothetical protein LL14B4_13040 (plasmid) [Lactococcus lactis subsp. lactis]|uniref:Uncharacterized protein n=1 Tax=Lactococcus lactis subsp. lactis TaxID=1360 RepID=A0A2Z3KMG2_LACLL|nr:hypothetical protein [Lactococcus lactis]AWN67125.1 hypothetical protein LL14B4_13040 [Lactococcus lactis subsp. lactis]
MKNKYNKFHNYQLKTSNTIQKFSYGTLVLKYEPKNIMDSLLEGFKQHNDNIPSYVSPFVVLPMNEKLGEQMFEFKVYDEFGFELGTQHVKESFLLYLSLSNQLVDATVIRNEALKEALKDFGEFGWLEDNSAKEDNYEFALDINDNTYDTLGYIDIYPKEDGSYSLEKWCSCFWISELHEIKKLLSIFYGSVFSLQFTPVGDKWVNYQVTIPEIKVKDLSELKETVNALRVLLISVDSQLEVSRF